MRISFAFAVALGAALTVAVPSEPMGPSPELAASGDGRIAAPDTVDPIPPSMREEHQEIRQALSPPRLPPRAGPKPQRWRTTSSTTPARRRR